MAERDEITYRGKLYYRYPNSKRRNDRVYFRPYGGIQRSDNETLHRQIWIDHNGPIPEGGLIHHIDGDPLNNSPDNLKCVTPLEHAAEHEPDRDVAALRRHLLENVVPKAAEWHGSSEGRDWHSEHAKRQWKKRKPKEYACQHCGGSYQTRDRTNHKFCSNRCKAAARRASGVDDEQRICEECSGEYTVNKYSRRRFCSSDCYQRTRS